MPDQPSGSAARCPTPCDADCEATCHEGHNVLWKKDHPDEWCQLTGDQRRTINAMTKALHRLGPSATVGTGDTSVVNL